MTAFLALYRTAAREFLRDRVSVILTLVLPMALAGFFGMVLGQTPHVHARMALALEDQGAIAQQVALALEGPELRDTLSVKRQARAEALAALQAGKLDAVLVIPDGTTRHLEAGSGAQLTLHHEKGRPAAEAAASVVGHLLGEMDRSLQGHPARLSLADQPFERHEVPMAQTYVARMLAIAILWLGVFGTAPAWVALRDQKILRRLAVTPLRPRTILLSQIGWRLTVGLIQAALLIGFGVVAFHVEPRASWGLLIPVEILGTAVFVALGFALASLARSAEALAALGQLVQFPMMFLSGTLMPLDIFPEALRQVALFIPLTYLGDALSQLAVGAAPAFPLGLDVAVLVAWGLALGGVALWRFRWE